MTCLLAAVGSIGELIDGLTTLMWVFYGLVFTGLIVMRFTRRQERRPFKVSGDLHNAIIKLTFVCMRMYLILVCQIWLV